MDRQTDDSISSGFFGSAGEGWTTQGLRPIGWWPLGRSIGEKPGSLRLKRSGRRAVVRVGFGEGCATRDSAKWRAVDRELRGISGALE